MQQINKAWTDLNPPPADKAAPPADPAAKGGKGGGMRGGTPVTPTDDQLKTLTPKVAAMAAAMKDLQTVASDAKVLGATDGPRYTRQAFMQAFRDLNPNMGGGKGGKGGGGGGGGA
jgi:hypothetical protein